MAFATQNPSSPITLTDTERADFARLCSDLRSGKVARLNAATEQLETMPPLIVQALLIDLWQQEEPARRRKKRRLVVLSKVLFGLWGAHFLLFVSLALCRVLGVKISPDLPLAVLFCNIAWPQAIAGVNRSALTPRQNGAFDVLRRYKSLSVTSLYVDALDFPGIWSPSHYRSAIREILSTRLPEYAASDNPPLDEYQQQILLREIEDLTRQLRVADSSVNDTEVRFVNAAVTYLMDRQQQPVETPLIAVVEELAALSPSREESPNRRLVREVAEEYLPTVKAGR